MKNFLKIIAVTAVSASCLAIISCANPKATQAQAEAAIPEASKVSSAALKPLFSIAAPGAATLNKLAYFYDQDRGESFFITAPAAKTLFQIGASEGELMQTVTKTISTPLTDIVWAREIDSLLFTLNSAQEIRALSVDPVTQSIGAATLQGLEKVEAIAVSKLTPGYQIAIIDAQPETNKLKLFRADVNPKTYADKGDIENLTVTAGAVLDLGMRGTGSLMMNPTDKGFLLTQGNTLRFIDNEGEATEQATVTLKADIVAVDVMVCNRGTDKGYWIALQQTDAGYQIELLRRLSFESLGVVSLDGVKSVTDMRFMGRSTKYLPNGGVFMIADGKLAAYNWHDIAAALGARKMCF